MLKIHLILIRILDQPWKKWVLVWVWFLIWVWVRIWLMIWVWFMNHDAGLVNDLGLVPEHYLKIYGINEQLKSFKFVLFLPIGKLWVFLHCFCQIIYSHCTSCRNQNLACKLAYLKGTVYIISSDPPCTDSNVRITMVLLTLICSII